MSKLTLKEKYLGEAKETIAKEFDIKNPFALPRITKVVVNMGTGEKLRDKNQKEKLLRDFSLITGQAPKVQNARISVAGFGIREGMPVGLTSTLRRDKMWNFLEKLVVITLPRLRDFRGVKRTSFDQAGNYTLGIREHTVFPEIDLATVEKTHSLEVTIVFENSNKKKSFRLLESIGMPFEKEE